VRAAATLLFLQNQQKPGDRPVVLLLLLLSGIAGSSIQRTSPQWRAVVF